LFDAVVVAVVGDFLCVCVNVFIARPVAKVARHISQKSVEFGFSSNDTMACKSMHDDGKKN
jgi:hypothetical protein